MPGVAGVAGFCGWQRLRLPASAVRAFHLAPQHRVGRGRHHPFFLVQEILNISSVSVEAPGSNATTLTAATTDAAPAADPALMPRMQHAGRLTADWLELSLVFTF